MNSTTHLTRRETLRWSAGGFLLAGLWPGSITAGDADSSDDFYFLVVNDLHYFDSHCVPWFQRVTTRMKQHTEKIDFLLLAGDLSHQGKQEQFSAVQDILSGLGLPFHAVIGNHDFKDKDSKAYQETFPNSINYHFEHRGWQFLGLDSCDGTKVYNTAVQWPHAPLAG